MIESSCSRTRSIHRKFESCNDVVVVFWIPSQFIISLGKRHSRAANGGAAVQSRQAHVPDDWLMPNRGSVFDLTLISLLSSSSSASKNTLCRRKRFEKILQDASSCSSRRCERSSTNPRRHECTSTCSSFFELDADTLYSPF